MSVTTLVRAAIVDDEIDGAWARHVRKNCHLAGLQLDGKFATGDAYLSDQDGQSELVLLDWELDSDPDHDHDHDHDQANGMEIARQLVVCHRDVAVIICTKYGKDVRERIKQIDPRAVLKVIDKPIRTGEKAVVDWIVKFLRPVVQEVSETVRAKRNNPPSRLSLVEGATMPALFELQPGVFRSMPRGEQKLLRRSAYEEIHGETSGVFAQFGDVGWLAVSRIADEVGVIDWGHSDVDVPMRQELERMESERGAPVMVVSRPPRVELIDGGGNSDATDPSQWTTCSYGGVDGDAFPSLRFSLDEAWFHLHFDTGSSHSFVDFSVLVSEAVLSGDYEDFDWLMSDIAVRGEIAPYEYIPMAASARCMTTSGHGRDLALHWQVIDDWDELPLSLTCKQGNCAGSTKVEDGAALFWCGKRRGLVGRDILRRNAHLTITLDPSAMESHFNDSGGRP